MPDFTTIAVTASPLTAAYLDTIVAGTTLAPGAISGKPAAGVATDTDILLAYQAATATLQQTTLLGYKNYLQQLFSPAGIGAVPGPLTITTAGEVATAPATYTQLLTSTGAIATMVGRVVGGWLSFAMIPGAAATALRVDIYRMADAGAHSQYQFQCSSTNPLDGPQGVTLGWADGSALAGTNTYVAIAQGIGGPVTVNNMVMAGLMF